MYKVLDSWEGTGTALRSANFIFYDSFYKFGIAPIVGFAINLCFNNVVVISLVIFQAVPHMPVPLWLQTKKL